MPHLGVCEGPHCRRGGHRDRASEADFECSNCGTAYCGAACQRADWADHMHICDALRAFHRIGPAKAQEMIDNPPRGHALSAKQRRLFEGIAHGWHPTHLGDEVDEDAELVAAIEEGLEDERNGYYDIYIGANDQGRLSAHKAGVILKDKEVRGHPLTSKQQRFFGWVRGGRKPYAH